MEEVILRRKKDPPLQSSPAWGFEQWSAMLDAFSTGEQIEFGHLLPLPAEAGVRTVQLLADRSTEAFQARFDLWHRQLERDISLATTQEEHGMAIRRARDRLLPLWLLATHEAYPEILRTELSGMIRESVENMQQTLESQAKRNPVDREERLRDLLGTPLTSVFHLDPAPQTPNTPGNPSQPTNPGRGRRVII